jgi:hypothetical protein
VTVLVTGGTGFLDASLTRLLPVVVGMGLPVALDAHHVAHMDRARSAAQARDGHS